MPVECGGDTARIPEPALMDLQKFNKPKGLSARPGMASIKGALSSLPGWNRQIISNRSKDTSLAQFDVVWCRDGRLRPAQMATSTVRYLVVAVSCKLTKRGRT